MARRRSAACGGAPACRRTRAAGEPTPPSPRTRPAAPARALPASSAPRLAAPACEQYAAGLAGTFPRAVQARGASRALALLTESVASALLGMPVTVPAASRPEREVLEDARARISTALAAGDDAKATAIARATTPRIAAYAHALGITGCQRLRVAPPPPRHPSAPARRRATGRAAAADDHATECWYSVKPIALQTAATIQKRRMIFVSDQAWSSKWWWIGAIRKTRLRKVWNEKTWMRTLSASTTKMPPRMIEQDLGLGHHREPGDRAAEAERAGVAHEDRRREGVEPEEADAGADQAARQQREVVLARS